MFYNIFIGLFKKRLAFNYKEVLLKEFIKYLINYIIYLIN